MSNSLRPHGLQHARPLCPSPTPGVYSNSCPLSQWCHPAISSSVVPFSSCLQSFPASGSFQMHQLFASGGQSIGVFLTLSVNTYGLGKQPVDAPLLFVENKKHSVTMSISDQIGREEETVLLIQWLLHSLTCSTGQSSWYCIETSLQLRPKQTPYVTPLATLRSLP